MAISSTWTRWTCTPARSRSEFAKRVSKVFSVEAASVESALLALVALAEKKAESDLDEPVTHPAAMTDSERAEALALLRRPDLLDQVAQGHRRARLRGRGHQQAPALPGGHLPEARRSALGDRDEPERRRQERPHRGDREALPAEDVVLLTRLTPQSLYYIEPGFLDKKLVIVEERYGSIEADYSIRVLQSRKKLIAAAPIKDPPTGNMTTKIFTVEARAAFIEATTASSVNHENATRCFELTMDETRRADAQDPRAPASLLRTERGLCAAPGGRTIARRHWNAQRLLEALAGGDPLRRQAHLPLEPGCGPGATTRAS